ncbi:MAG TPA: NAD-dependent epimerase/dehydratase family protein, partial [Ottowia sp.]|nr:NAD-dependent epimerase/dehydratase family protein [Ottowia sp.]
MSDALATGGFEGRTVLVTGGAGAIGSNLCRALAAAGAGTIVVLDDLSSSAVWNVPSLPNLLFVEGSVLDDIALKRVFNRGIDDVFHLAAFFANQNSVDYPERDLAVNGMGILKVLEYSRLTGVDRFVYAS